GPAVAPKALTVPNATRATAVPGAAAQPGSSSDDGTPPAAPQEPTAAPAAHDGAAPRLAIIIDDCGQWPDTERGFIALPVALTLSVLPHVRFGAQIARDADSAGKGVMLHLPMEPRSGADPGPGGILTAMDDAAIAAQVRDDLTAVPLATGVNNHEGSRATADDRVMRDVAAVLAERHVFFIDSRTGSDTVAERSASAAGVPTARRDVFLDDVADVDATEAQLRRAVDIAKTKGSAIAIGHPRPTTLIAVRTLLPELERAGIVLVLARDLVR
ncbi:MAG: polysaccharide deacetylase, partial [Candidatus Eremiobacteraeota bacterium]|nr:polysaccharide deacetylase [Candidatus Eremiobacteraeota bacterium]